jgi:hypothetical protein
MSGGFDHIVEIASAHPPAAAGRYTNHNGTVHIHEGISPISFLNDVLFGVEPLFPPSEDVVFVGGVLNATGGGCLNCAFDALIKYQQRIGKSCTIGIPMAATYGADDYNWQDLLQVEQITKDLLWKLAAAGVSPVVARDSREVVHSFADAPLIRLCIETNQPVKEMKLGSG